MLDFILLYIIHAPSQEHAPNAAAPGAYVRDKNLTEDRRMFAFVAQWNSTFHTKSGQFFHLLTKFLIFQLKICIEN